MPFTGTEIKANLNSLISLGGSVLLRACKFGCPLELDVVTMSPVNLNFKVGL